MDIQASEGDKRACVINSDHIPTGHVRGSLDIGAGRSFPHQNGRVRYQ